MSPLAARLAVTWLSSSRYAGWRCTSVPLPGGDVSFAGRPLLGLVGGPPVMAISMSCSRSRLPGNSDHLRVGDAVHASCARSVCRALHDELTASRTWHPYRRNLAGHPSRQPSPADSACDRLPWQAAYDEGAGIRDPMAGSTAEIYHRIPGNPWHVHVARAIGFLCCEIGEQGLRSAIASLDEDSVGRRHHMRRAAVLSSFGIDAGFDFSAEAFSAMHALGLLARVRDAI